MKLTNMIRDAFVRAAMTDVPSVDYTEQAHKLVHATLDARFKKDFPGVKIDRTAAGELGWLSKNSVKIPGLLSEPYTWTPSYRALDSHPDVLAKLEELAKKHQEQKDLRRSLESKLKSCAYSVTTRKALADMLPEFAKYLPADEPAAARTLPVVANVVAEFTKAGWPKGKKA